MTSQDREMVSAGYAKTRVSDLQPNDIVRTHIDGQWWVVADYTVSQVVQYRGSSKRIEFVEGGAVSKGNASKIWKKVA